MLIYVVMVHSQHCMAFYVMAASQFVTHSIVYGHCAVLGYFTIMPCISVNLFLSDSCCTYAQPSLEHKICIREQGLGIDLP
jgi:hypothetical protein